MFSGPWWAASLMSNRSLTTRLIMSPVLTRSYQLNEKRSYWSKEILAHAALHAHAHDVPQEHTK